MAKQLIANYTYSKSGKTVTLTDWSTVRLDRLLLIWDATINTALYNFADPSIATATVATNVITLSAVPSASADADKLLIFYDALTADTTYDRVKVDGSAVTQPVSGTVAATQSGTWTVQPGNTANTTAWKVDGSAVTQPASIADGSLSTLGAKADTASTATDTTAVSVVALLKQLSKNTQAGQPLVINKHVSTGGTLTANTAATPSLTWSSGTAVELEVSNRDGAAIIYGTLDNTTPSSTNFTFCLPATPCNVVLPCNGTPTLKLISAGTPSYGCAVRGY